MNRSIFQIWNPQFIKNTDTLKKLKTINLNFGPQHPAAHGVLRLVLQLNGEIIEKTDAHVGLLHRGTEKLIENKLYLHSVPYFDRFDYVSMLVQEHAYCLAIEELQKKTNYTSTFLSIRTLFDELTRILNHMLAIGCHALDVGSMSALFWSFEEREKIMEFYERVSGARMHAAFYRPNDINISVISIELLDDIAEFCRNCFTTLNEMHNILTYNKIWKQRLINIGVYSTQMCLDFGLTGVMARCVGFQRDLRLSKFETYSNYYYLNFRSFIGLNGDSYDRFLIRMNEMVESLLIVTQVLNNLYNDPIADGTSEITGGGDDYEDYKENPDYEDFKFLNEAELDLDKARLLYYVWKNKLDSGIPDDFDKIIYDNIDEKIEISKNNNDFSDIVNTENEFYIKSLNKIGLSNIPKYYKKLLFDNIPLIKEYINTDKIKFEDTESLKNYNYNILKLLNYVKIDKEEYVDNKIKYNTMEETINHFKYWSEGFNVSPGFTYKMVESPKGEFGVSLISDGSNMPYRCKVRSPAYHHLQCFPKLSKGHFLADLATLVGTIDIVFGEIDR